MNTTFQLFPDAASTAAEQVDALYLFMVGLATVLTVLVATLVIYFAVRYRRTSNVDRSGGRPNIRLEITWIVLSVPLLMGIFYWGASVGFFIFRSPESAANVNVVAKQWMWKFQHASGRREIDELHVPVGRPTRLTMISQDVIHSFFVPAFRVKQDVLPGRYLSTWFEATKPGEYRLYCAEYCGTNHSRMVGRVVVMTPGDFAGWLSGNSRSDESPVVTGQKLFEQLRCGTCHAGGGAQSRGPALTGIFKKPVPLRGGETVIADESYLRESILRPAAKVVAGYQPIMPSFEGQISEEGILDLIAYIKSLSTEAPEQPADAAVDDGLDSPSFQSRDEGGGQE